MPAHELWLKVGRSVLLERGFGITHVPGDVRKRLSGDHDIDPLTGAACARVTLSMTGAMAWTYDDAADYSEGYVRGYHWPVHNTSGAFRSTTTAEVPLGAGFFLAFLVHEDPAPLTIEFGAHYALTLETGLAELLRDGETVGVGALWDEDVWPGRQHYLYVYAVGERLCLRRLGETGGEGIAVLDPAATGRTPKTALAAAPVSVSGTGIVAFAVAPERHETAFSLQHDLIELPETSSTTATTALQLVNPGCEPADGEDDDGQGNDPAIQLLDAEDAELEFGAVDEFAYRVEATLSSATGPNLYVSSVAVAFPELCGPDGLTGTNLLALPGAAVQSVEESLSLDARGNALRFHVLADVGELSPYVQANMRVQWKPLGVLRFDGLTDRPHLQLERDLERLTFDCRDPWKRLEHALWSGDAPYAGKRLAEAYQDAALRAGLDPTEIHIYSGGYDLPEQDDDGPPLFDFAPGQSIADVLLYLRDQFGAGDVVRFKAGQLYAEEAQTVDSGVTFYWSTTAGEVVNLARRAPTVPRILRRSWDEDLSEEGLANWVTVVGMDKGENPLIATKIDWSSINDDSAANYVGEPRLMVIVDAGLTTQSMVNWVCCQVWERLRSLRVYTRFKALYVSSLIPGELVTIDGRGQWRILSMRTTWDRHGPLGLTDYEAELVA